MKKVKKIIAFMLLVLIIAVCYLVHDGYSMYKDAISKISIEDKVNELRSKSNYVYYKDIPEKFSNAIIAIEDHRFRNHHGVDIISIGRATVTNIKNMSLTEGGSTITQQLAKNLYFTQEKKFVRKIAEVFLAYDLEKKYEKNDILELYINVIYFGNGYNGIMKASKGYFNKTPNELTLDEITLLAGIPNAPSVYALNSNPELAKQRQNMVIDAMYKNNYLTEEEVKILKNAN